MALGAATRDVSRLFLRHGLILVTAGVVAGTIAAALLSRVMSAMLFGAGAARRSGRLRTMGRVIAGTQDAGFVCVEQSLPWRTRIVGFRR